MSARARDWAYSVQLPLCQKFVLVALAERANDEGIAWPSARTISDMTGACERAVRYALKQLEQGGFIMRVSSSTRSKTYQLSLDKGNEIPAPDAGHPARHAGQPAPHATAPDAGYLARHAGQPAPHAGQTGTKCTLTVKNRKEPIAAMQQSPTGDWVTDEWMNVGNSVLIEIGHDPTRSLQQTGCVRQWLADARRAGYEFEAARETILAVVRERAKFAGRGKPPAWFTKPVAEAIQAGVVKAAEETRAPWADFVNRDYADHVTACVRGGKKRLPYAEFRAAWEKRNGYAGASAECAA
ncbi:helix-turn-helix domain-containing protein [Acetobacter sp. TBRC 12305]|uniref:Helix-turn-helix domain-containing protein n=1 Tax=Acetobacter garciniae TaxID=2817435 RepID=A0A939HJ31_9PROT|nr:helix-turn-helix domain-containing protein [Acetobacter garciniae]MBO1325363.1 helix-turn-helix domain-containing protein [Acetobacter garciniae]MBX0345465.1 helix-turn-helix domain-containing protein [Acetobacter garciniae]